MKIRIYDRKQKLMFTAGQKIKMGYSEDAFFAITETKLYACYDAAGSLRSTIEPYSLGYMVPTDPLNNIGMIDGVLFVENRESYAERSYIIIFNDADKLHVKKEKFDNGYWIELYRNDVAQGGLRIFDDMKQEFEAKSAIQLILKGSVDLSVGEEVWLEIMKIFKILKEKN